MIFLFLIYFKLIVGLKQRPKYRGASFHIHPMIYEVNLKFQSFSVLFRVYDILNCAAFHKTLYFPPFLS